MASNYSKMQELILQILTSGFLLYYETNDAILPDRQICPSDVREL